MSTICLYRVQYSTAPKQRYSIPHMPSLWQHCPERWLKQRFLLAQRNTLCLPLAACNPLPAKAGRCTKCPVQYCTVLVLYLLGVKILIHCVLQKSVEHSTKRNTLLSRRTCPWEFSPHMHFSFYAFSTRARHSIPFNLSLNPHH